MPQLTIPIIPIDQTFYHQVSKKLLLWDNNDKYQLDHQAITTFCSLGFMLNDETFFQEIKTCKASEKYELNDKNVIVNKEKYWQWHYNPTESSFKDTLDKFTSLFENLIKSKTRNKRVLLPISGGLDSRTLFVPLINRDDLTLASYEFEGGFPEAETGRKLSKHYNIPLHLQNIQRGYLWGKLNDFHQLNNCFTDFIHPRQVDAIYQWKGLGDVILLGHWGDVLFDKQADTEDLNYDEQVIQLKKKILKPGGIELAEGLWKYWGLKDTFESYITDRLDRLYSGIKIEHPSARIRAFKSLYWAPRWTSINLSIFSGAGDMVIPYYSDEMCKFICTVPERYLEGRKIQIEYIKQNCPEAARIPWQKYYPLNLYQHHWFNHPGYYPVRALRKLKRVIKNKLTKAPDLVTRNWELQFLGETNLLQLQKNLMYRSKFNEIIPPTIITDYLKKFEENPVKYAHPLSMLLTLAVFLDRYIQE